MLTMNLLICEMFFFLFDFVSSRKHLLYMLLILEFIVLVHFLLIFMFLNMFNWESYFLMVFLTFSVCEGSLGLSILVSMISTHGSDYIQSLIIM